MDPPPYSESEGLNWNIIASKITTENISPRIYYALQVLTREYTQRFVGISQYLGSERARINDLRNGQIYWKILHIFDESQPIL